MLSNLKTHYKAVAINQYRSVGLQKGGHPGTSPADGPDTDLCVCTVVSDQGHLRCRLRGSSVHGTVPARTPKWDALFPPGDLPSPGMGPASDVAPAVRGILDHRTTRQAPRTQTPMVKYSDNVAKTVCGERTASSTNGYTCNE